MLAQLQQVFSLLDNWDRYHPAETRLWSKKQFITDYIAPIAKKAVVTDAKKAENIYKVATILNRLPELKAVCFLFNLF